MSDTIPRNPEFDPAPYNPYVRIAGDHRASDDATTPEHPGLSLADSGRSGFAKVQAKPPRHHTTFSIPGEAK